MAGVSPFHFHPLVNSIVSFLIVVSYVSIDEHGEHFPLTICMNPVTTDCRMQWGILLHFK